MAVGGNVFTLALVQLLGNLRKKRPNFPDWGRLAQTSKFFFIGQSLFEQRLAPLAAKTISEPHC